MDKFVREKFGYGKYGIPHSPTDPNRHRWIALKRWNNDQVDRFEKEVVAAARATRPGVAVMSGDFLAPLTCGNLTRLRDGRFDVVLTQLPPHLRPNSQNGQALTRIFRDLARPKELWVCSHLEDSDSVWTRREAWQLNSQFFQNGMTGLYTWAKRGRKPYQPDVRLARPELWKQTMDMLDTLGEGWRVKLPEKAAAAILLSELSQMSIPGYSDWMGFLEGPYAFLGPVLGSDFEFISDLGIASGVFDPSAYKLIVTPFAQFAEPKVVESLAKAVEGGATLLVTDPEAFSYNPDGSDLAAQRKALFGNCVIKATIGQMKKCTSRSVDFLAGMDELSFKVPPVSTFHSLVGKSFTIKPDDASQVILTYGDGSPAGVVRKLGKGRVVLVGFNIYQHTGNQPPSWDGLNRSSGKFMGALVKSCGVRTNMPHWNIMLPKPKVAADDAGNGACLTGNAVVWRRTVPKLHQNAPVGVRYTFSRFPDAQGDSAAEGWIACEKGALTDRVRNTYEARKPAQAVVAWNTAQPITLKIDLGAARSVSRVKLWVGGAFTGCRLLGGNDPANMKPLTSMTTDNPPTDGVAEIVLTPASDKPVRYLNVEIPERPQGALLRMIEMEVWNK